MKKEALIIFVRKPELGKVKTRLAASIGVEAALAVYQQLLKHTQAISSSLQCDKYVFYVDEIEEEDIWHQGYLKLLQAQKDLGGRMKAAFTQLFEKGHQRICIIGSDCFDLTPSLITSSFSLLHQHDVVIGPAKDGGYYLLGMRGEIKDVFDGIEWSTEKVLVQTQEKIIQHGLSSALLPVLTDVDTIHDVPEEVLNELKQGGVGGTR